MIDYARPLLAFLCFLLLAYAMSDDRYKIPWRVVVSGIGLQMIFAMLLLYLPPVKHLLLLASDAAHAVQTATDAGSSFVFGYLGGGAAPFEEKNPGASFILAFKALPMILTISALASLFFFWGLLQRIAGALAQCLRRSMRRVMGILNADGAFAEYVVVPVANLHVVPDSIPNAFGAVRE